MANKSGSVYGLTILSPIIDDPDVEESHTCALREYLAALPQDHRSPFGTVSSTHIARLVVMDDVVFVGAPAREEHLQSPYLVFESNFDGDLNAYLARMAADIPETVNAIWQHCVGYPGLNDVRAFIEYMKGCQLTTTFYFADVNNRTVEQTLKALQTQDGFATFVEENQGKPSAELQKAFLEFWGSLQNTAPPAPGAQSVGTLPCFARSVKGASH